ncbi:MAG: hypothetical protein TQ37_09845 [Candidatus Synechococcus spongiarum 15L]|uniref:Response receiver domain-containing protein n=1 Tax=Candidatus Synechococcus spongiarum 15L TaxID=1608419 RepID=A0A0G8ARU6_9SYNE|nr:MAG: hypothetical protein TQ37_09845 [Candidatus Synechococcus spongiarum 15L]
MAMAEDYQGHSHELAQRFLQTAVVVDDEAYMESEQGNEPTGEVVNPSRTPRASGQDNQDPVDRSRSRHSLDAGSIINSFSKLGVICGVVSPTNTDSVLETMRKADIVILDWLLRDSNSQYTQELLRKLLDEEADQHSLRLVSIYTGKQDLETVCDAIVDELQGADLMLKPDNTKTKISYRHGHVVIYAKSNMKLKEALQDRSVPESALPGKLVADFASMTSGLLPRITLTSLAAVREGEHKVLDRFSTKLDPAFLAHRACLPNPGDAERQIVSHVAEELRGLMDNAVAEISPQDVDAVKDWIEAKAETFKFGEKTLNREETITLATQGLQKSNKLKDKDFKSLSAGFSGGSGDDALDEQLAWIMSFRTVYNVPAPILWLGSVVTKLSDEGKQHQHLICMRPRCDCMRLTEQTSFFFLPLVQPGTAKKPLVGLEKINEQIIVSIDDEFERLDIEFDSSGWVCQQFEPLSGNKAVIATKHDDGHFVFRDNCDKKYTWRGELKAEYAQRIAQSFAARLSRVAVDESEWLRRMARMS